MLVVDGLTKRFGDVLALDDVELSVGRGEIVGFLGPNGAGKTTAMRAIMGLVAPDAGAVTWDGAAVGARARQSFGYMPAERGLYVQMTVRDHLVYYGRLCGLAAPEARATADRWLERLGLADRAADRVQTLSSGNQQRVQLALALLNDPDLLVLDEPFSGLDPVAADDLGDILRARVDAGAALLLSSHQLDLVAAVCTAVVIVHQGRVVLRGDVAELRAASPVRYLEVELATPGAWSPGRPAEVSRDGRRHRITLGPADDASALVAEAAGRAPVVAYSLAPPGLSEVFAEAVGAHQGPRPAGGPTEAPA